MRPSLSPNTQAILLLTAPLLAGRGESSSDLLSPGEYKRLARHLQGIQHQPADLVAPDAADLIRSCRLVIDAARLQRLLGRGFLLSQAIERWQARAIWVVSPTDPDYPSRYLDRLGEDAPSVLYGCGDPRLLRAGGLAVVGSRHASEWLLDYTLEVGKLAAAAGCPVLSGGARGIDQAAMGGGLEAGGQAVGVLADSLERATMVRENRNLLLERQLVVLSPYDPNARFNVGQAMQRNKLVYALADAALVVNSDLERGGTWAGATEQLRRWRFVPVYVRAAGPASDALDALRRLGALGWPEPPHPSALAALLRAQQTPIVASEPTMEPPLGQCAGASPELLPAAAARNEPPAPPASTAAAADQSRTAPPAGIVFAAVQEASRHLLGKPLTDAEYAESLEVTLPQARAWLKRLCKDGAIVKLGRPARYRASEQAALFEYAGQHTEALPGAPQPANGHHSG